MTLQRQRTVYRVTVPEHQIDRWQIPASQEDVELSGALAGPTAKRLAEEEAGIRVHVRQNIPPWKPYMRQTLALVSSERIVVDALARGHSTAG